MRIVSKFLGLFLFCLWLAPSAWCENWTHKDLTWVHKNSLSVTFPADYKVTVDKNGFLNATAKGGFVSFVFTPIQGKEQMKGAMKGILQTMEAAKVTLKPDTLSGKQNGLDVAFQEGSSTTSHGVELYVKLGIFNKKGKQAYLLMQLIVPQKLLEPNAPLIKQVVDSIK